ncbi:PRC-barrel domain-containing protein [Acuticoccus sp. MNP-M23]|uniref:PRC-barrel domain-containing protein n=1 Tax=Acuticoccus sp. MNP-M23 TaxID=3072793 RepID=UPI002814D0C1|nr:PRC-barrel domain-containing protein [Acuticoccus sp. MNP-M23]WMS41627.1 PRC-barrel domain-containing protein [Acuticoccus sp. MNP-M23]
MRKFSTMTAVAALASTLAIPALAQTAEFTAPQTDVVFTAPTVTVDGYSAYSYDDPTTLGDILDDAELFSSITNEEIGEVEDVYPGANGGATYVELEIGGFLGLGEKEIVVPLDQLTIVRDVADEDYRVYIAATEEQLENYPEYDD